MFLTGLTLSNFKNYEQATLDFNHRKFVCFTGANGIGKTNLLDAIHYLSLGKSYFNPMDRQNILHGATFFNVKGTFEKQEKAYSIFCSFVQGKKKTIKKNNVAYEKIAEHIGQFPNVIITPYDVKLINEGSEERRKFLDSIIAQIDHQYLANISKYQRTLNQRNARLKEMAENHRSEKSLVEVYDEVLCPLATAIHQRRKAFLEDFNPLFNHYYAWISGQKEEVALTYQSQLNEADPAALFRENFQKDLALQRTTCGIHKDDLDFTIFGYNLKRFGSQGQQKSYLIAVKLAQYDLIKKAKGDPPLLLLDDIYDRLDDERVGKLMETITSEEFSQVFITDTSAERLRNVLEPFEADVGIFEINEEGVINT